MTRKHCFLTILTMVLFTSLLLGCSSAPAEPTPISAEVIPITGDLTPTPVAAPTEIPPAPTEVIPTPTEVPPIPTEVRPTPDLELSIVWSDDFEDGDYSGWEELGSPGFFYVNEGVLTVGPDIAAAILHRSEVAYGTWSFDVFISDKSHAHHHIGIMYDEEGIYGLGIEINTKQKTVINFFKTESGVKSIEAGFETEGQISGWNHIDITRDEEGHSTVYLNREPILKYTGELSITPYWFCFSGPVGSVLDNVVVRDIVIGYLGARIGT